MPPRPDHSAHGETLAPQNGLNTWTKDTKTKTCFCETCGKRVKVWSWRCDKCRRSICSECCEDDPSGVDFSKQSGKDHIEIGCWCKRFGRGQVNPRIKKLMQGVLPPKMEEQRAKDQAAKKKAQETSRQKKAAAAAAAEASSKGKKKGKKKVEEEEYGEEVSEPEEIDFMHPDASAFDMRPRSERRKNTQVQGRDEGVSPGTQPPGTIPSSSFLKVAAGSASRRATFGNTSDLEDPFTTPRRTGQEEPSKTSGKRSSGAAHFSEDGPAPASSGKKKKSKKSASSHLDGGHTIIVGAGIVGLFTAYELATLNVNNRINHPVTVVEILPKHCELASGQCAGFLHCIDMPKEPEWLAMWSEAHRAWGSLVAQRKNKEFQLITSTYSAEPALNAEDEGVPLPSWFQPKEIYYAGDAEKVVGRIDPRMLADWLKGECDKLGVQFLFGQWVDAVRPSGIEPGAYDVDLGHVNGQPGGTTTCSHLIFAAGPYTKSIVQDLFYDGKKLKLSNTCSEYLWMDVPLEEADEDLEAGVAVTTTDAWSAGMLTMVVRPGSDKIEASAAAKQTYRAHLGSHAARNPAPINWSPLNELGKQFLRKDSGLQGRGGNGAIVSVARGGQPYVGLLKVPREVDGEYVEKENVWLCYGFGRYGTSLAPGAARKVVAKMMGLRGVHRDGVGQVVSSSCSSHRRQC